MPAYIPSQEIQNDWFANVTWWKRTQSGTLIWNLVIFPWRTVWGRRASIREVVIPWLLKEREGSRRIGFVLLSGWRGSERDENLG